MSKRFNYLTNEERSEIEILKNKGYSIREISRVLGRSPNTISKLKNRRFQYSKIESIPELKEYIIQGLKKHWNPDEISGRMKKDKMPWYVSKSAIYEWLETTRGERYKKYLYGYRPGRRHKKKNGLHGQILHMIPIEERLNNRTRYGHWESDCMVSKRDTSGGLSTHIERKSRLLVAQKVSNLSANEKQKTLTELMQEFYVKSIAFDRGRENGRHYELGIKTYFCNSYHPQEKGSIENANKMIRKFFPKKTDFSSVSQEEVNHIVSIINNKPRKILNYSTAYEVALAKGVINRVS